MAGINVLSNIPKGGNKSENTVTSKGKEMSDGYENAAAVFAALLNGRINLYSNSKGQSSSSTADQDTEEKQSNANSVQSDQNLNGSESILGYGNFVLPFLTQMTLQSDLPAGKEANSGESMSQGIENYSLANAVLTNVSGEAGKNLELAMLNLLSLASDEGLASTGMMTLNSQGDNLGTSELDKYRQVISNLLVALSGVITDTTPEGVDNMGTQNLRQELAKIIQGWMIATDDAGEEAGALVNSSVVSGIGTKDFRQELGQKTANLLAALYPILAEGGGTKGPQEVNEALRSLKGMGIDLESIATAQKDEVLQKSEGTGLQEAKSLKNSQTSFYEEVNKMNSHKSIEPSGTKDGQNQSSSTGIGLVANVMPVTLADGKTVAVPVWEQISTVVREQVMNNQQALKQLDIQLHPEDLGKIRIFLRWESGQVHLQVNATEGATGQLLQNQLSELRQNLMNQGVNCGSLQMGQDGERRQQPHGDEAQRMSHQSNTLPNEDEDLIPIMNPLSQGGINRINVTA